MAPAQGEPHAIWSRWVLVSCLDEDSWHNNKLNGNNNEHNNEHNNDNNDNDDNNENPEADVCRLLVLLLFPQSQQGQPFWSTYTTTVNPQTKSPQTSKLLAIITINRIANIIAIITINLIAIITINRIAIITINRIAIITINRIPRAARDSTPRS